MNGAVVPFRAQRSLEDIVMKRFAVLAMVVLAGGPAAAQTTPPAGSGPAASGTAPRATHGATGAEQINERITQMHQRLKITPDQQPAWDEFAQVMRDNMTSVEQAYQQRRDQVETMSAPDNMRNFAQIEAERAAGIQKLAASFQTLYDGMSEDQRKVADSMFRHYEDRGPVRKRAAKAGDAGK